MKYLLAFLLILNSVFFCDLGYEKGEKPFLAVFSTPGTYPYWKKYKPDFYFTAKDWDDLPVFLSEVRKRVHRGQKLKIDIDCHGSDADGLLYIQYEAFQLNYMYASSVGALVNKIDESGLKPEEVYLESCFARICMETTLTNNRLETESDGDLIEDCKVTKIDYPIYGVGVTPSISNLIFLEARSGIKPYFEDLRNFASSPADKPDISKVSLIKLKEVYGLLSTYVD